MNIHFIGIGGIGVSALARYYLLKGHKISGSDLVSSEITQALRKKGVKIYIGPNVPRTFLGTLNLVVYSPAVPKSNPELKKARKLGIRCLSYPEALGELTKQHFTIAISGTHGKSTTTAMIALILVKAGLDPTVIVGTKIREFRDSNCRVGKSKYLVIEADEHFASFLNYWPKIIILTNIEKDHLDYYKNLGNILKTFKEYIGHLGEGGFLVINRDDPNIKKVARGRVSVSYSLGQPEAKKIEKILKVPGEHNVYNALAALAVARILKIPDKISFKALSGYKGAWRRFEIINGNLVGKKITIISDYGHHPTKVRVTLKAAREKYPKKKIWCVYQPHQYQRTYYLFKDFVKTFRQASGDETSFHLHLRFAKRNSIIDKIIITDIFDVAGREEKEIKRRVSSEKLVKAVRKKNVIYLPQKKILNYLEDNLEGGEVVIIMGAGDIYKLCEKFRR